jgi:hypothetical protein
MSATTVGEAEILEGLIMPDRADMSPDPARAILALRFNEAAQARIRELLDKNGLGTIAADERVELGKYRRVGQFVDLMHAKTHLSLKSSQSGE